MQQEESNLSLVVSTCLAGAFVGSLFSGSIADGCGRRRVLQLSALPMTIGASISATTNGLEGMLLGRFLVGTGMGLGPSVASLYVSELDFLIGDVFNSMKCDGNGDLPLASLNKPRSAALGSPTQIPLKDVSRSIHHP
ncbi:hypothetical protein Dimus_036159, partial [Dionaea muscipula]